MLNKIDHFVVLMMENRSFDQMLGRLYDPSNPPPFAAPPRCQTFEGIAGKNLRCPIPPYADPKGLGYLTPSVTDDMVMPNPDPGEEYCHVNTQLYGQVIPQANQQAPFDQPPYNLPTVLPQVAPMNGFVTDYANVLMAGLGKAPSYEQMQGIMAGFAPHSVPVISQLAASYGVCDHWHASVPSQTFGNRAFVHCGTAHGFVNNLPIHKWLFHPSDTIFNRLHEARDRGLSFGIYWDPLDIVSWTFLLNPRTWDLAESHGKDMDTFFQDAAGGTLPNYSFIEPRLLVDNNDQHPPASMPPLYEPIVTSSVLAGEKLIADVYNAVRDSPAWERTMLIIIYDEHGGSYDHVQPPASIPPSEDEKAGEQGFTFNRLGVRIPAVIVSPYTEAGLIDHQVYDHTSVIKTLCDCFSLQPLTRRDQAAAGLGSLLNLQSPRTDRPIVTPRAYVPSAGAQGKQPLTFFQKGLLALAVGREFMALVDDSHSLMEKIHKVGEAIEAEWNVAKVSTIAEAVTLLQKVLAKKNA